MYRETVIYIHIIRDNSRNNRIGRKHYALAWMHKYIIIICAIYLPNIAIIRQDIYVYTHAYTHTYTYIHVYIYVDSIID